MVTLVLSLPTSLILLVHLHILEYPHANKPEYDHNIFSSQARGLRDRIKTLEDICYFLVGRLEGNARTILPSYPCAQPSDTVAFRTSLAKYLETLRHQSVFPSSKVSVGAGNKVGGKSDGVKSGGSAWWWKDVLVRKSLLEECSGEKFERLILSVSTHALLKGVASSAIVLPDDTTRLFRTQPNMYTGLLFKSKSRRHVWSHSAALLLQRQGSCKSLRELLESHGGVSTSKYSHLETERLVSLVTSKLNDLHDKLWYAQAGRLALQFLARLYGLTSPETLGVPHTDPEDSTNFKNPTTPPQPLPIAAAHHPANLKKLRKPVFSSTKKLRGGNQVDGKGTFVSAQPNHSQSVAEVTLSGYLDSELGRQREIVGALAKLKEIGQELLTRAKTLEDKYKSKAGRSTLTLWQPSGGSPATIINFTVKPTPELLSSLSLHPPFSNSSLESQIDDIRDSILPSYPIIPDLFGPRLPYKDERSNSDVQISRIPRANTQILALRSHASESNSKSALITSTPSLTLKNSRKVPLNDGTIKSTMRWGSKTPRKSIRFSLAVNSRLSLFPSEEESDEGDAFEDEINRIVHGIEDESMENIIVPVTPKPKAPPVNRIFTGTKGSTAKRPKQSYPMVFHEPSVALPLLIAASTSLDGLLVDSSDEEGDLTDQGTPNQKLFDNTADGNEGYENEAPSMTLRDILLRADTTDFDLLDEDGEDGLENESFEWD
ncbi:hypothetical protein BDZ94DRAFT_1221281 [Collybia nuda]|uniref:HAUS augmin-like complex subunit 6 N-terminal domain-containing protein n=1 Tax=Collybia nuda TaxID=64659 RepID=A0A9P6CD81_9AGAR|nr:hypothetical protein BDZ94DRAFT_1221281 [Collybia nuda]